MEKDCRRLTCSKNCMRQFHKNQLRKETSLGNHASSALLCEEKKGLILRQRKIPHPERGNGNDLFLRSGWGEKILMKSIPRPENLFRKNF